MAKGGVIETQGMVTSEGKAFVTTFVNEEAFGQMSPAEAIAMGTRCIQSAIEAERDAGTIAFLKAQGASEDVINGFILGMRDHRDQAGPKEGLGN